METVHNRPVRAVLYLRVAQASQPHPEAIARQRLACEQRAAEIGAVVVAEYLDVGSGMDAQRPELQRILTEIKEHQHDEDRAVAYFITFDHARIARDMHVYVDVVWRIEDAGARLEVASVPHVEQSNHWSFAAHMTAIGERQHEDTSMEKEGVGE